MTLQDSAGRGIRARRATLAGYHINSVIAPNVMSIAIQTIHSTAVIFPAGIPFSAWFPLLGYPIFVPATNRRGSPRVEGQHTERLSCPFGQHHRIAIHAPLERNIEQFRGGGFGLGGQSIDLSR